MSDQGDAHRVLAILDSSVSTPKDDTSPQAIRLDNWPEFLADRLVSWCADRRTAFRYIQLGKPNQNTFVERFIRTLRQEALDA